MSEDKRLSDQAYTAFLSELFGLLESYDAATLAAFRLRKPGLGPELLRVIESLADFRSTMIEGKPSGHIKSQVDQDLEPVSFEDRALVEDIFRSRSIFPQNDDLKAFVRQALKLDVYGKNYSRSMILDRVIRELGNLQNGERVRFLSALREFRKQVMVGSSSSSYLDMWSKVIKGS